ncbi:DegT/DnrJ/EryC1/StrS family aminotransferase [Sphingomonas sp.]|uniref:DegT/DnrJ/EryC1/StrS family aminotransferase n=1 Tax=Sphingomonas sp. TaxID=28214 RepID=UPI0025F5669F|nr:DegT/DnrJ/EryC1/StrS family aminotransferase [Sphingomonas sp.]
MQRLPLIVPNPPRLADYKTALERIEVSGIYSNFGPEARRFEQEAAARLFGGEGACLTVANATLGLMLALKDAVGEADGRYAVMPALTFAATAQAAWWAGLTPLVCDIDPDDWTACPAAEERLLHQHGDRIAALVPYAAFGHAIDLDRYAWLAKRHEVKVVIDAAASLGTSDAQGRSFGAGAPFPVVFSMHATKPFAVAEGGLIHCGDRDTIERLRAMANFGFAGARSASVPGLNAKLPEVLAAIANAKLETFGATCAARERVTAAYRAAIGGRYATQPAPAGRQALGFFQLLLPRGADRARVAAALEAEGIGTGQYFSPHIGQQPWVRQVATIEPTPVADDVAGRILSLPLHDAMTAADAERVIAALDRACAAPHGRHRPAHRRQQAGPARRACARAGADRARPGDRRRPARPLCHHLGFDRADLPQRGGRQSLSRDRRARRPSGGAHRGQLSRRARRAAGGGRPAAPRDGGPVAPASHREWREGADRA